MRNLSIKNLILLFFVFSLIKVNSQSSGVSIVDSLNKEYLNWYNLDQSLDNVIGVSTERTYKELLVNETSKKKIIVAVIDGGVDVFHEDLNGKIWTNKNEIPDNGIDDDKNGYIDDYYGWNFIGNINGDNVQYENYEFVRLYKLYKLKYENIKKLEELSEIEQKEYKTYIECKKRYNKKLDENSKEIKQLEKIGELYNNSKEVLIKYFGTDKFTLDDLKKISKKDNQEEYKSSIIYRILTKMGVDQEALDEEIQYVKNTMDRYLNLDLNARKIIGDSINDYSDRYYGNSQVKGPDASHGTFVAGVIAANRNNGIGINGIAENVEIMAIRVVPDGDERDKDVALGIRYAVDNGANIINMSFGKDFVMHKSYLDDAIKYAEENNVLLVHAAGNDSENIESLDQYPNDFYSNSDTAKNWIEVGASSYKLNKKLAGDFTNYAQTRVDLFAPGVDIISLYPNNKYKKANGTSFSCPITSGVAALIWSYFSDLTAVELKEILLNSVYNCSNQKVFLPSENGKSKKVKFSKLSVTGGIVNSYNAFKLAKSKLL